MGHGASAGWIAGFALVGALSAFACGGSSERFGDDDGSSDDDFGGSSGSSAGGASNGGASQGGSAPTGGVSQGGTIGAGGTISVGGMGTGGAPSCDCPMASYGLVVEGDGPTFTMPYNGFIDAAEDRAPQPCPGSPLRGTVGGCSRTFQVSACMSASNGPPCLEIGGSAIRYIARSGELFTGWLGSDNPQPSSPGVVAGTLVALLANEAGEELTLTVSYSFCAPPLSNLRIVC